ncbi:MAG: hypothetical protein PHF63_00280 [Herbinix sp.]|nr:hypothetical protein [Herbinix sp.]
MFLYNGSIVQEAYYGKNPKFKKCEEYLQVIIKQIYKNIELAIRGKEAVDINKMPEVVKFNKLMADIIGVKTVSTIFYQGVAIKDLARQYLAAIPLYDKGLHDARNVVVNFDVMLPFMNACSIPTSVSTIPLTNAAAEKMKDKIECYINFDEFLIVKNNLSTEEVLALCLHEIGHSISSSLVRTLANININLANGISLPDIVTSTALRVLLANKFVASGLQKINVVISEFINKHPKMKEFFDLSNEIIVKMNSILSIFPNTFMMFLLRSPSIIFNYLNPAFLFGYGEEARADSFATANGYGIPLSKALFKIDTMGSNDIKDLLGADSIFSVAFDISRSLDRIALMLLDVHPDNAIRIQKQLNKLKRDLNKSDYEPRLKKELQAEIKQLEDFINNSVLKEDRSGYFNVSLNYSIMKVYKGNYDPRELLQKIYNTEY